jgi:putative membrane protein
MNRYARWAFALALLPVAACSSSPPPVTAAPVPVPPPLASVDQTFINAAAASDASEIQTSQLAQTKARSARIKTFAAKMVTDHTATTQQLTTIAQSKGATITPASADQQLQDKLTADKPRAFDHDYINAQIAGHKAAVKLFQDEIANGQDADLKTFAQTTLPTIQQHLKLAEQIGGHS